MQSDAFPPPTLNPVGFEAMVSDYPNPSTRASVPPISARNLAVCLKSTSKYRDICDGLDLIDVLNEIKSSTTPDKIYPNSIGAVFIPAW